MLKAIAFAKEIERKKHILKTTNSYTLKRDTEKCVQRYERELRYYCKNKGISYNQVKKEARRELTKESRLHY